MANINPIFAQLALDWLDAEREADPERWKDGPKRDDMTVAIDRVYQVITGNVLWSEASAGDKAIWKSRVESVPTFARTWSRKGKPIGKNDKNAPNFDDDPFNQVTPRRARRPPSQGYYAKVWWNYYDTVRVSRETPLAPILFRVGNVGNPYLCNLQVAGQIRSDHVFWVTRFYVATDSLDAIQWAARRVFFRFCTNEQPRTPEMFVRDLFRGIVMTTPITIPVRMGFSATCSIRELPPPELPPFDLTFHFEGLEGIPIQ